MAFTGPSGVAVTEWITKPPPRNVDFQPSGTPSTAMSTGDTVGLATLTSRRTVDPGWVSMSGKGVVTVSAATGTTLVGVVAASAGPPCAPAGTAHTAATATNASAPRARRGHRRVCAGGVDA